MLGRNEVRRRLAHARGGALRSIDEGLSTSLAATAITRSGSILGGERGGNTTQTFSQRPNVTWVTGQLANAG
jgi:hypothetical protein